MVLTRQQKAAQVEVGVSSLIPMTRWTFNVTGGTEMRKIERKVRRKRGEFVLGVALRLLRDGRQVSSLSEVAQYAVDGKVRLFCATS